MGWTLESRMGNDFMLSHHTGIKARADRSYGSAKIPDGSGDPEYSILIDYVVQIEDCYFNMNSTSDGWTVTGDWNGNLKLLNLTESDLVDLFTLIVASIAPENRDGRLKKDIW